MSRIPSPFNLERAGEMYKLYLSGVGMTAIGQKFGMSRQAVWSAINRYNRRDRPKIPEPPPRLKLGFAPVNPRIFCNQCERNVLMAEASQCASQFCKAKVAA